MGSTTTMTAAELAQFKGTGTPVYVAVRDPDGGGAVVFDVSAKQHLYGADGPYAVFAGVDATRALAKSSTKAEDLAGGVHDLSESERKTWRQWFDKFASQYPRVATLEQS